MKAAAPCLFQRFTQPDTAFQGLLNTGNNRRLNRALQQIALTRLKHHPPTRTLFDKKLAEGTTKRAALRVLKTVIARSLFRVLTFNQNQVSKQLVRGLKKQLKEQITEAA